MYKTVKINLRIYSNKRWSPETYGVAKKAYSSSDVNIRIFVIYSTSGFTTVKDLYTSTIGN